MIHDRLLRGLPLALVFALLLLLPSTSFGQSPERRNSARFWSSDYRGALAAAQRESKPLMVIFRCVP